MFITLNSVKSEMNESGISQTPSIDQDVLFKEEKFVRQQRERRSVSASQRESASPEYPGSYPWEAE